MPGRTEFKLIQTAGLFLRQLLHGRACQLPNFLLDRVPGHTAAVGAGASDR